MYKYKHRILLIYFAVFGLFSSAGFASTNIDIVTIGVEQGLPQSTVRAIKQDKQGMFYFATDDGISRFDGQSHHIISSGELGEKQLFSYTDICIDKFNRVWASSLESGFLFYDPKENFAQEFLLSELDQRLQNQTALSCLIDNTNSVFLNTEKLLVVLTTSSTAIVESFNIVDVNLDYGESIVKVVKDSQFRIFLLTTSKILYFSERGIFPINFVKPFYRNIIDLKFTEMGEMWLLTDLGVFIYKETREGWVLDNSERFFEFNQRIKDQELHSMSINEEYFWVLSKNSGAYLLNIVTGEINVFNKGMKGLGISDNYTISAFHSQDGISWIGTWLGGVNKIIFPTNGITYIDTFLTKNRLIEQPSIRSIFWSKDTGYLIGTDGEGLLQSEQLEGLFKQYKNTGALDSINSNFVRVIFKSSKGEMIIGTESGLTTLNSDGSFSEFLLEEQRNIVGKQIRSVVEDSSGNLFVGTYDKGLFLIDNNRSIIRNVPLNQSKSTTRVTSLMFDSENSLWVATDNFGVYEIDPYNLYIKANYHVNKELFQRTPSNSIWSIYEDEDKNIWLGSYGQGVASLEKNTGLFTYFNVESGMVNNVAYSIFKDTNGWYWVSTNRGISRFNLKNNQFTILSNSDGIGSNEFNSGAYFFEKNNELLFGGVKGLTVIDNNKVKRLRSDHRVFFNGIKLGASDLNVSNDNVRIFGSAFAPSKIEVKEFYNDIVFNFSATEYRLPEKLMFRFKLVGFDDTWQQMEGASLSARYTHLSPGDYELKVKARNSNGIWTSDDLTIAIKLHAPWYISEWAVLFYIMFAVAFTWGMIIALARYRQRNQEMLTRLSYLVDHRTQELKQKNEQLEKLNQNLIDANERLETVSMTDALTGLGNRRMLYQYLDRDIALTLRSYQNSLTTSGFTNAIYQYDVMFFMIDIDHFKKINDVHGHLAGDKMLVEVADVLKQVMRDGDYIIRYGGEEFLLVTRNTARKEAPFICQRIEQALQQHDFKVTKDVSLNLTCSIGFTAFPFSPKNPHLWSSEQSIQLADLSLYCAKNSGRNCWVGLLEMTNEAEFSYNEFIKNPLQFIDANCVELFSSKEVKHLVWQSQDDIG